jgi:pantothenate kinase
LEERLSDNHHNHAVHAITLAVELLPPGVTGIDAGMTLTKTVRAVASGVMLDAMETHAWSPDPAIATETRTRIGVTGGRVRDLPGDHVIRVPEIEAGVRGVIALLESERRLGDGIFVLAILGTGTAFAAVREGVATHLGGTALGGGSFSGIAGRVDPSLSYEAMISAAERGDRRNVDAMISDVYPDGIGRIGPDLTAAHLARGAEGSVDDFLAGLLNLHGESIGQIAAARAVVSGIKRIVLAGGFAHHNALFTDSLSHMAGMFGIGVELAPAAGFAGAIGAALVASEQS